LPLPKDAEARARALVEKLLEGYAGADSLHSMPAVPRAVEQVFLLPVPGSVPGSGSGSGKANTAAPGQLAVVNLSGTFADGHPSGILTETLTVESICGTLHANLPEIAQVRFLVDGKPRATLAGHADLTRTYLTAEAAGTSSTFGKSPAP
jgi:hypothetical protein